LLENWIETIVVAHFRLFLYKFDIYEFYGEICIDSVFNCSINWIINNNVFRFLLVDPRQELCCGMFCCLNEYESRGCMKCYVVNGFFSKDTGQWKWILTQIERPQIVALSVLPNTLQGRGWRGGRLMEFDPHWDGNLYVLKFLEEGGGGVIIINWKTQ